MKNRIHFAALVLTASILTIFGTQAAAQKKNKGDIWEGKVEAKLGDPGTDLRPDKIVYLYPKGQNAPDGLPEAQGPLVSNGQSGDEIAERYGFITNVSDSARFEICFPEHPNGQMVIVTPGGSYYDISSWGEGLYAAKWMTERGITTAVMKYRLPCGRWQVPLQDVQNAFRYCRVHAKEWGVDQIGIMGGSAGGHLASTAETMYNDEATKPDFAVLLYPVISMKHGVTHELTRLDLLGADSVWKKRDNYSFIQWYERQKQHADLEDMYSTYNAVSPSTPPTFIGVSSDDDIVPALNSALFFQALADNKVPAEVHFYPRGKHGWGFELEEYGFRDGLGECRSEFSASLERFLDDVHKGNTTAAAGPEGKVTDFTGKPDKTVFLYPEGQDSDKGLTESGGPGESTMQTEPEKTGDRLFLYNVGDKARFDLYFPQKPNGTMAVICPGGGYWILSMQNKGIRVADWLLERGYSVCILKYRIPQGHWTAPLTDYGSLANFRVTN